MDSLVNDEERILNLMAKFRLREVNPTDYDSKLAFWKQTIRDHCAKRSCALFSVQELKETFRWHGRVPSCLETVLLEMRSAGDAKRLSQFEESVSSWLTWSYRRILVEPLVQLIWGSSGSKEEADQEQYVLVDLIKEFADKIYELRKSASRDSTIGQNVVTWTGLRESVSDICSDEKTLMLTVKYLRYNGLIATSQDEDGEMIVKFRMTYEKTSPTITESDISALKLKKLTEQLDADIHKVNAEIDSLELDARKHVAAKNQIAAKRSLRQKHVRLKKLNLLEESRNNALTMLHQIESASDNQLVLDALEKGNHAFRSLAKKEMTLDKAYEVMDQVQQTVEEEAEISEAVSSPTPLDMSELEEELAALLSIADKKPDILPSMPEPPAELPEKRKETVAQKADMQQVSSRGIV